MYFLTKKILSENGFRIASFAERLSQLNRQYPRLFVRFKDGTYMIHTNSFRMDIDPNNLSRSENFQVFPAGRHNKDSSAITFEKVICVKPDIARKDPELFHALQDLLKRRFMSKKAFNAIPELPTLFNQARGIFTLPLEISPGKIVTQFFVCEEYRPGCSYSDFMAFCKNNLAEFLAEKQIEGEYSYTDIVRALYSNMFKFIEKLAENNLSHLAPSPDSFRFYPLDSQLYTSFDDPLLVRPPSTEKPTPTNHTKLPFPQFLSPEMAALELYLFFQEEVEKDDALSYIVSDLYPKFMSSIENGKSKAAYNPSSVYYLTMSLFNTLYDEGSPETNRFKILRDIVTGSTPKPKNLSRCFDLSALQSQVPSSIHGEDDDDRVYEFDRFSQSYKRLRRLKAQRAKAAFPDDKGVKFTGLSSNSLRSLDTLNRRVLKSPEAPCLSPLEIADLDFFNEGPKLPHSLMYELYKYYQKSLPKGHPNKIPEFFSTPLDSENACNENVTPS